MKHSFSFFKSATCLAVLLSALAAGSAWADDRKEIEALYGKLQQALKNKTPEATLALETPDFTAKGKGGKPISGKQLAEEMKQDNGGITDVQITIKKATITGKTARVTTQFRYSAMMEDKEGRMGPKGQSHEMSVSGVVKNSLVKTASGWKFKTMEQGPGKATVDGKPMDGAPKSKMK